MKQIHYSEIKRTTVLRHNSEKHFCLVFYFQRKFCSDLPYLTRNHLSFLFLIFFSQIFILKLNLRSNISHTYAISTVKRNLGMFTFFFFYFSLLILNCTYVYVSQQYCENYRKKNEQTELVENQSPKSLPYRYLHNLQGE